MVIPKKAGGPEPGSYRTDRTPYAREVMRALSPQDPHRRVVVMGASQLLKTQVALNWISASIHQSPGNILALFPTEKLVKRVSHRISETIKAVPKLNELVAPPRSRDARNTIDAKEYDGGTLYLATARSASNLAEISCRYVYGDELDRWEMDVGGEGDPVELAEARTSNFGHSAKIYYSSSPTIEGASLIETLYLQSDQRRYYVPCPHCQVRQELVWSQVRWDDALTRAVYVCPECGAEIEEHHKSAMLAAGEWRAQAAGDGQTAGFQLSQLYAPLGWSSWLVLARKYVKAKTALERGDKGPMQVFYNTRLALTFDATDERTRAAELKKRAEDFPALTLPLGCLELTMAVDTQGNRLEYLIMGWGEGMERWVIDYGVLMGRPSEPEVWVALDKILIRPIVNSRQQSVKIGACLVDSGGNATQEVYEYTRARRRMYVLAVKGGSKPGRPVIASKPSKVDINRRGKIIQGGAELWMIGTDTAKDWLFSRWLLPAGPGAIHFNRDLPDTFYDQLTAERKLVRYVKGFKRAEYVKTPGDANEALDLCVYNLAAAHFLGLHKRRPADWKRLRDRLEPATDDLFSAATPAPLPPLPPPPPPPHPSPSPVIAAQVNTVRPSRQSRFLVRP
jgi:phage terminase large subunit GpA-like protein